MRTDTGVIVDTRRSRGSKLIDTFVGVVLPLPCFALVSVLEPSWQDGLTHSHVKLLLRPDSCWPFYPFLGFSMACLLAATWAPQTQRHRLVRLGLLTGVVLALQFSLLLGVALLEQGLLASSILALLAGGPVILAPLLLRSMAIGLMRALKRHHAVRCAIGLGIIVALLFGLIYWLEEGRGVLRHLSEVLAIGGFSIVMWSLASASWWCFAVYLRGALLTMRCGDDDKGLSLGRLWAGVWTLGFVAAWHEALQLEVRAYAALPTQPPDCYVCTAAARGHASIVQSAEVQLAGGNSFKANDQMRQLKCAELIVRKHSPTIHRTLRSIYDRVGPRMARALRHRLLADASYVLLKPAEWLARGLVVVTFPDKPELASRLYR